MNPTIRIFAIFWSVFVASIASAADYPAPTEGDFTIRDFKFQSGETLPELRIHYRTLGKPEKDAQGKTTNAVLIMHGTTGSGAQFIRPEFAGELFGKDQPLDATKFFIVLPDGIGHGKSSKPSDGMHAKFPRYGYLDMVEARSPAAHRRPWRESRAAGDGNVDGRNAHVAVGRTASRFHGRAYAAGEFADADFGTQPRVAPHGHRRHPQRSVMERWRI